MLISLPNAFGDAATNMAIDASLLDSIPEGLAAFRHYGWTEPAATFGYAQKFAEVENIQNDGVTLCRRLTGGGIVDHRNDWTYALVSEASLPVSSIPATVLYERIHRTISQSISDQGIQNRLAPCPRLCGEAQKKASEPDQCFVKPAANDVVRPDGQKMAGAAMKRSRNGLLIQGSIDRSTLPESFNFDQFQKKLLEELSKILKINLGELEDIRPLFDSERIKAHKERFRSEEWKRRR